MKKLIKITFKTILPILLVTVAGCKKLVEVDPPKTSLSTEVVFSNNITAAAVVTGILSDMSSVYYNQVDPMALSAIAGLSADELILQNPNPDISPIQFYTNDLLKNSDAGIWTNSYLMIFRLNSALEGLNSTTKLSESVKNNLLGEVYFLRAFYYFQMVNLYGGVPLAISTDYKVNGALPRASSAEVYQQITSDLTTAVTLLPDHYSSADGTSIVEDRVRPNKAAAIALLARTYLYTEKWQLAEQTSTQLIDQTGIFALEGLTNTFLSNSKEAIWQLQPVTPNANTVAGLYFTITSDGFSAVQPVSLSEQLVNDFAPGDQRRTAWINAIVVDGKNYYYSSKYKNVPPAFGPAENVMVLRLAEQYLIRAEARLKQGNMDGFNQDISKIRLRAGLTAVQLSDPAAAMAELIKQRRLELFTEWGHRWFDLKRTGQVDAIMTAFETVKGGHWVNTDQLYPIPLSEILLNNKLTQNPGY